MYIFFNVCLTANFYNLLNPLLTSGQTITNNLTHRCLSGKEVWLAVVECSVTVISMTVLRLNKVEILGNEMAWLRLPDKV